MPMMITTVGAQKLMSGSRRKSLPSIVLQVKPRLHPSPLHQKYFAKPAEHGQNLHVRGTLRRHLTRTGLSWEIW